ncbi:hypothetical protein BDN67DRAFT_964800 [Paxillus ammoniavirescens]|nr:hypothetical protein BDN67DRAFT_964800 [Paxillus ammoniavirescens]
MDSNGHCASVKPPYTKVQVENTQHTDISTFTISTSTPKQLSDSKATLQPLAKNLILPPELPSPTNCITPPSPSTPATPITLPYSSPSLCPTIIVPCGFPSSTTSAPVTSVNSSTTTSSIPVKSNLSRPIKRKKLDSTFIPKASKEIGQPHTALVKPLANITHAHCEVNAVASSSQIMLDTTWINIDESDGDDRRRNTNRTGFEEKVQKWADAVQNIHRGMLGLELFNDEPVSTTRHCAETYCG